MSEIEAYRQALKDFQNKTREASTIARIVREGAAALVKWHEVVVSNPGSAPSLYFYSGKDAIDGNSWPDAEKLDSVLRAWHQAKAKAKSAYGAIPAKDRVGIDSSAARDTKRLARRQR